jgi:hypothetical protein
MATVSTVRRRGGFSAEQLLGLSGLALLAALPLQVVGFLLHPPSEQLRHVLQPTYGPAHVVLFGSWALAMLGLPGLYARQAGRAGVPGLVGFALTMVAGCYHCYLALYEGFAVPVMARQPATQALLGPGGQLAHGAGALGAVASLSLLGFPLLGVATVRARVFPRGVGWLQILCVPVFFALMIVQAMVFGEGNAGPNATSWVAGMLSVAMLYWLLFAGYAWAGARLCWPRVAPVATEPTAAEPTARPTPAPR